MQTVTLNQARKLELTALMLGQKISGGKVYGDGSIYINNEKYFLEDAIIALWHREAQALQEKFCDFDFSLDDKGIEKKLPFPQKGLNPEWIQEMSKLINEV